MSDKKYIIDLEGYHINNTFYIKELAIYNIQEHTFKNIFYKCPMFTCKTYQWILNNHHGVPSYYGDTNIGSLYNLVDKSSTILCKGIIKRTILSKYFDKVINIEAYGCPKYSLLDNNKYFDHCQFDNHQFNSNCALKKLYKIVSWYINNEESIN